MMDRRTFCAGSAAVAAVCPAMAAAAPSTTAGPLGDLARACIRAWSDLEAWSTRLGVSCPDGEFNRRHAAIWRMQERMMEATCQSPDDAVAALDWIKLHGSYDSIEIGAPMPTGNAITFHLIGTVRDYFAGSPE
ncbi:MAG TPA: hypothetical protein VHG92_08510 [Afifellaceae bacterium]|nr:hypothetical protein [Afifellaceae bacterium]